MIKEWDDDLDQAPLVDQSLGVFSRTHILDLPMGREHRPWVVCDEGNALPRMHKCINI